MRKFLAVCLSIVVLFWPVTGVDAPDLFAANIASAAVPNPLVATSTDERLKILSWFDDDVRVSTRHRAPDVIALFKADGELHQTALQTEEAVTRIYTGIETFHTKNNKTVYLAENYATLADGEKSISVQAFAIEGGKIVNYPFFHVGALNLYDMECQMPETTFGAYRPTFKLSEGELFVPIISADGSLSSQQLIYKFDGRSFNFCGFTN